MLNAQTVPSVLRAKFIGWCFDLVRRLLLGR